MKSIFPLSENEIQGIEKWRAAQPIETLESEGAWWADEHEQVLAEHRMTKGKATIYNTMHWHRVFNFTGWNRMVISAAIRMDIEDVANLYDKGELFND